MLDEAIIITESLTNWGGQQKKVYYEIESILGIGLKPVLVCNRGAEISVRVRNLGIDVYEKEISKKKVFRLALDILKISRKIKSDLIVCHGSTDSWASLIAKILSFGRLKVYREKHNLYEINGVVSRFVYSRLYDKVLVVSNAVRDYMIRIGCREEQLFLLPDAVDVDTFAPDSIKRESFRSEHLIPFEDNVVGVVTTLKKEKGLDDLIESCSIVVKDLKSYFVFGGRISDKNRRYVLDELENRAVDLSKVVFTGFVRSPEKIYNGLDLFVHLSHSEGMGTVLIEAMSVGLPIVVWNIRPMSDLVQNHINGRVVEFGDFDGMAEVFQEIMSVDKKSMDFRRSNIDKAKEQYSKDSLNDRIVDLLMH